MQWKLMAKSLEGRNGQPTKLAFHQKLHAASRHVSVSGRWYSQLTISRSL
jgi:hypothetical protein